MNDDWTWLDYAIGCALVAVVILLLIWTPEDPPQ